MNVNGAGTPASTGATRTAPAARTGERRDTSAADGVQPQADFELALRAKQARRDGDDQGDERDRDEPADGTLAALAAGALVHLPVLQPTEEAPKPAAPRTFDAPPTAARAKLDAALNANIAPSITAVGETDPAALWEASVREPNSIAVDVRALRAERSGQEAGAAWTVSVKSSSVGAETLARHAPRLDERLRKRAAGFTHVRIEQDDPDPQ